LLDEVAAGKEIAILRRGKEVARLVPAPARRRRLPSRESFRKSITLEGEPMSVAVIRARRVERF
jgi:antitoxin (DNA-binding transcriptional repressor) of toxin-antitoxin stability system